MSNLGVLAEEAGVLESARSWWEKAAELGDAKAIEALKRLEQPASRLAVARLARQEPLGVGPSVRHRCPCQVRISQVREFEVHATPVRIFKPFLRTF
jgi:hypothetical protein